MLRLAELRHSRTALYLCSVSGVEIIVTTLHRSIYIRRKQPLVSCAEPHVQKYNDIIPPQYL